jgi:hypothetical protein
VYFNVNFNMFLNKKVHLLVSELYMYQNARCNNKNFYLCLSVYYDFRSDISHEIRYNRTVLPEYPFTKFDPYESRNVRFTGKYP